MYLTAAVIAQLVGMVRSVLLPLLFMPAQLGIWNLMSVILGYGGNAHLGILHSMNKAIPVLRSQGKIAQVEITKDSVFWLNILLGGVAGTVLWLGAGLVNPEYETALRITSLTIFLLAIFSYYFSLLRADNRFNLVSFGVGALGVLSTVLVVFLALSFSDPLIGALSGITLAYMLVIMYWLRKGKYRFTFRLHLKTVREMFLTGIPLISICILDVILLSVDRWIVVTKLGGTMLGYYALGIMASNMIALVPGSIASVLYPKMLERHGVCGNPFLLRGLFAVPTRAVAALMSILIGASVLLLPFLIKFFLPKYTPSITLLSILLAAAFFYSSSFIPGNYLVSINRQKRLIQIQMVTILLAFILDLFVIYLGCGIVGIALSTAVVYLIYGCSYMFFAAYYAFEHWKDIVSFFVEVYGIFAVMIMGLTLSIVIIPDGTTMGTASLYTAARLILFSVVLFPVLWWFNRQGELSALVRQTLIDRFSL